MFGEDRRREDVHGLGLVSGQQYWLEFYEKYYEEVRDYFTGYVKCPQDVEDLVQDVFARLMQRGHIPRGPRAYIRVAAKNRLCSYWRSKKMLLLAKQKKLARRDNVVPLLASDLHSDPLARLSAEESRQAVVCAIANLPRESAEVLRLRIIRGLSFDEIAQEIGCSHDTAKKRLQRARQSLLDSIRRRGDNDCAVEADRRYSFLLP